MFQSSTKANIYAVPTLLLHFWLSTIRHRAHFNIIEEALHDYYPANARLQSLDIPFNLSTDDAQLKWPSQAEKIMARVRSAGYKCIVAIVTNHTDDDHGDFWLGVNEDGDEPRAAAVEEVSASISSSPLAKLPESGWISSLALSRIFCRAP